jgi:hypothetical protein
MPITTERVPQDANAQTNTYRQQEAAGLHGAPPSSGQEHSADAPSTQLGATTELKLDHLAKMLTDIGVWQHGKGRIPDKRHGYSIDDEARALIVALKYIEVGFEVDLCKRVADICFRFLENAAVTEGPDAGRFHNFCDQHGKWLDSVGSDDSFGRTMWALGVARGCGQQCAPGDRADCLLRQALPVCETIDPIRSKAFVLLGLAEGYLLPGSPSTDVDAAGLARRLADSIAGEYERTAGPDWRWFQSYMTYCNARLPHALFVASQLFPGNSRYAEIAVESLDFLLSVTHNEKGSYSPVGNAPMSTRGWFNRGEPHPPLFDQQPVDAGALVECCVAAYEATAEPRFRNAAYQAYGWYFGDNVHSLPLYDSATGAVCDALTPIGVNANSGAESIVSIHLAAQALRRLDA